MTDFLYKQYRRFYPTGVKGGGIYVWVKNCYSITTRRAAGGNTMPLAALTCVEISS